MLILARMLSLLAVVLTALAIDSWRLHILPWGSEGTGYVAFFSFALATLAAISALAIGIVHARSGSRAGISPVVLLSAVCLVALIALVVACPGGC